MLPVDGRETAGQYFERLFDNLGYSCVEELTFVHVFDRTCLRKLLCEGSSVSRAGRLAELSAVAVRPVHAVADLGRAAHGPVVLVEVMK